MKQKTALAFSVLLTLVCTLLIPKVNVNADMTKYLPDDSGMRQGIRIISDEFDESLLSTADIRVMFEGIDSRRRSEVEDELLHLDGVVAGSHRVSGDRTLYELTVEKSVNQKSLAADIRGTYGKATVETAQDGNTPAPGAIILAIAALLVILFIMSPTWMEPLLYMASTGMAVLVNVGTNVLFDSVSITTNSIAGVLQLALSIDYSIILMNRYRQQRRLFDTKAPAMSAAMKKAAPAIVSSALTTVSGLLMLALMRLKIGADLGFVLAKGVVCSLIFTYTALPGLILIFDRAISGSSKKVPKFPTDGIASFCERFSIPLAVLFIVLFAGGYVLHDRTEISFSTRFDSEIDGYFPSRNTMVVVYDNCDADALIPLADSLLQDSRVISFLSYPSLMQRNLTSAGMYGSIRDLIALSNEEVPESLSSLLSEDMLRLAYYSANAEDNLKVAFPSLVRFIEDRILPDKRFSAYLPDGLEDQLELMHAIIGDDERAVPGGTLPSPITAADGPQDEEMVDIHDYMLRLAAQSPSAETRQLCNLTDTLKLRSSMTPDQITEYLGSTPSQTKMVFQFKGRRTRTMTPLEFVRFLTDDLFNRKALAAFVSKEQKNELLLWKRIMDCADRGLPLPRSAVETMIGAFGKSTPLIQDVEAEDARISSLAADAQTVEPAAENALSESPADSSATTSAVPSQETVEPAAPSHRVPAETPEMEDDPRTALFLDMTSPDRKYTASEMSRNFSRLGEPVDVGTVELMYLLYGSWYDYDENWAMTLEQLFGHISSLIRDRRMDAFVDDGTREAFSAMEKAMTDRLGGMVSGTHSIGVIMSDYDNESPETEIFIKNLNQRCDTLFSEQYYIVGESVMFNEMKESFGREMFIVTIFTILVIFLIVTLTFRSPFIAAILVMTVMSAVFVNVTASGIGGRTLLYLAYLIVQSILMGATIDYGILLTTYFRENGDLKEAFRGSVGTIMTSGTIMVLVPGIMAVSLNDAMIAPIVGNLSIGALTAVALIMFVMPGVLSLYGKRKNGKNRQ